MRKIKILLNSSCYPTNIGNAFIDMGIISSLNSALKDRGTVIHIGRMSNYLFLRAGKLANTLPVDEMVNCDYLVMGGMVMCEDHLRGAAETLRNFTKRCTKIIIIGGGAQYYNNREIDKVRELLRDIPIYGFISRDRYTFENYKDLATYSYDGIDNGFFLKEAYKPIKLNFPEYLVINFDSSAEPEINPGSRLVIRTHHSNWPEFCKPEFFEQPYTLISDLASDYLNLYSQANTTFTDRIHAAIATLAYGKRARLYFVEGDKRLYMFERVGLSRINKAIVSLSPKLIKKERKNQIIFLQKILIK